MSILNRTKPAGGKEVLLQKQQRMAAKLSLPVGAWHHLVQQLTKFTKVHISLGEKIAFSQLGKRMCSHTLNVTYYRKSDNCDCSLNLFLGLHKCPFLEKNIFYGEYLPIQLLLSLSKFLYDHLGTLFDLYTTDIVGNVGIIILNIVNFFILSD